MEVQYSLKDPWENDILYQNMFVTCSLPLAAIPLSIWIAAFIDFKDSPGLYRLGLWFQECPYSVILFCNDYAAVFIPIYLPS